MHQAPPSNGHTGLSHPVEPHFARLPGAGEPPSGFWAEVATEGVLLLEREEDARRALDGAEFVVATATAALADRIGGAAGEPAEGGAVGHAGGTTASS